MPLNLLKNKEYLCRVSQIKLPDRESPGGEIILFPNLRNSSQNDPKVLNFKTLCPFLMDMSF